MTGANYRFIAPQLLAEAGIVAVPFSRAWSDLGSWDAVWRAEDTDPAGVATSIKACPLLEIGKTEV
ncbi:hypothetical protein MN188_00100 [Aliiroseovarius sp. N1Y82]|nr:hypothetical protein [Aliiroseovarius subalbicans]